MRNFIIILILCFFFQSCVKCYKEKDYSFSRENIEEKIQITGINDSYIIGSELSLQINKETVSTGLYLQKIEIYYQDTLLGIIEINKKVLDKSSEMEYTSTGDIIERIELREKLIEILEKNEFKLKINENYMSEIIRFKYEFYDIIQKQTYETTIHYRLSKHEKGCRRWMPSR